MTTCRVIALDPGGTTGWATATWDKMPIVEGGKPEQMNWQTASGQLGPDEHHVQLYELLEMQRVQEYRVISESFEYRLMDRRDRQGVSLMSKEYIGVAKLYCWTELGVDLIQFQAGQSKPFTTDAVLKKLGLWSWRDKHAMDAYRQLFFYLVRQQLMPKGVLAKGWK